MSEENLAAADGAEPGPSLTLPADLMPANAAELRDVFVDALGAAGAVALRLDGDPPVSPAAVQLAVAVRKSTLRDGRALALCTALDFLFEGFDFGETEDQSE